MTLFDYLKNIFLVLIFLQLAPSLIDGIKKQYGSYLEPRTYIGVLPLKQVIYDSTPYQKQLRTYFKNHDIKAILLKIDSSGSASGSGQALFHEIQQLKKEHQKPVIAQIENVCASGALWIACAADVIIASPAATIGSIGTYMERIFQLRAFIEHHNIGYQSVKAGTYKTATDPFVDLTEAEKTHLQGLVDDVYQQFAQAVSQARKLPMSQISEWADGKIFSGLQAKKIGLIDQLGSTSDVIKIIKEKALVEGEIEWIYPPTQMSIWQSFFGSREVVNDDDTVIGKLADAIVSKVTARATITHT